MKGGEKMKPMKVKVIVTQFVRIDETQFKSVVQNLTGKDASPEEVAWAESSTRRPPPPAKQDEFQGFFMQPPSSVLFRDDF
jgi:hypothetical protein